MTLEELRDRLTLREFKQWEQQARLEAESQQEPKQQEGW